MGIGPHSSFGLFCIVVHFLIGECVLCCVGFSFQWLRERLRNDLFCVERDMKPQSILPTWLPFPAYPAGCMCARVCVCDINVLLLNASTDRVGFWCEGCHKGLLVPLC